MRTKPNPPARARGDKRAQILTAARTLFLADGFASTSVDAVVSASGVSKPTVYRHFPTKEALLEGVVRDESAGVPASVGFGTTGDPRRDLEGAARSLLALALDPQALAWDRMLAGEARRKPGLGRLFFDAGPQRVLRLLAEFFRGLHDAGGLEVPDADRAAEFFFGLVVGVPLLRTQLGGEPPAGGRVAARCRDAAERFLRAYSPPPTTKTRRRRPKGA